MTLHDPAYRDDVKAFMPVPCGKCVNCRANYRQNWTLRLLLENASAEWSIFITMTYDDEHLPLNDNGVPDLCKEHVQKWMKRVEKAVGYRKMRHFFVGEFGDLGKRPHYHGLLFFSDASLYKLKTYDILMDQWIYGSVFFGNVEPASAHYVTKYCMKDSKIPDGAYGWKRPLFSSRPAIGVPFLEDPRNYDYIKNKILNKQPCYFGVSGHSYVVPRFIRDKVNKVSWNKARSAIYKLEALSMREQYRQSLDYYGFDEYTWHEVATELAEEYETTRLRHKTKPI